MPSYDLVFNLNLLLFSCKDDWLAKQSLSDWLFMIKLVIKWLLMSKGGMNGILFPVGKRLKDS